MRKDFVIENTDSNTSVVIISERISLEEAQEFVEGFVSIMIMKDGSQFACNDEGRDKSGKKLEPNPAATKMLEDEKIYNIAEEGILGNVLIFQRHARWL